MENKSFVELLENAFDAGRRHDRNELRELKEKAKAAGTGITINDRIREILGKDNVIMAGWNEKFEDGKKVYDCSTDIEITEGDRLGIELAAAHLLAVLVTNMEPESLDTQVTILAQINTLAAKKAAGFCKDKVTYRKPNKDIRTAIRE